MSTAPTRPLTPQEYLAIERRAEYRSEYFRGEMFAMTGGSRPHSLVNMTTQPRQYELRLADIDEKVEFETTEGPASNRSAV